MDILVLLFVVILLVIDSNVRKRVFTALAAAVNLRHSVDIDSDMHDTRSDTDDTRDDTDVTSNDTRDTRDDTDDISSDMHDTRDDMHVTTNDTDSDMHVTRDDTDVTSDDTHVTVSHDAIDAVSRLVAADVISATRACQIAFGVSQRGNAAVYRAVRARVAEIKKTCLTARQVSHLSQRDDIVDIRRDGRVIRCDANGRRYVTHSNGKKEYLAEKEIKA